MIIFFSIILVLSGFAIWTRYQKWHWYIWAKPLPLMVLLFLFGSHFLWQWPAPALPARPDVIVWVGLGLFFGLLGDIFLLKNKWFLYGLFAFLLGHLLYVVAWWPTHWAIPWYLWLFFLVSIVYWSYMAHHLRLKKRSKYLIPSFFYVFIISLMFILGANFELSIARTPYFFLGALLFCVSDALLGWEKFIDSVGPLQIFILATYYLAQTFITLGALSL